jgi:hypothetical protein
MANGPTDKGYGHNIINANELRTIRPLANQLANGPTGLTVRRSPKTKNARRPSPSVLLLGKSWCLGEQTRLPNRLDHGTHRPARPRGRDRFTRADQRRPAALPAGVVRQSSAVLPSPLSDWRRRNGENLRELEKDFWKNQKPEKDQEPISTNQTWRSILGFGSWNLVLRYPWISAKALAKWSMSSSVLKGPGLTRTVPSGKVPNERWIYGAQ